MKKLFAALISALCYFAFASFVTQAIILFVLFSKGGFTPEKRLKIAALFQDVDLEKVEEDFKSNQKDDPGRQSVTSLPLFDARESASAFGTTLMLLRQTRISNELQYYDQMTGAFAARLATLETDAEKSALDEFRLTIENMDTASAKDQLMTVLEDKAYDDAIKIVLSLAPDKQKKIVAEFRSQKELEQLEILMAKIREKTPPVTEPGVPQ